MNASNIRVLFDYHTIKNRIQTIAEFINEDYADTNDVVLLCVLKGAVNFFSDLSTMLNFDVEYEFVGLSSYEGTTSSGSVKLTTDLPCLKGKNIIIVDDILDTGRSMQYLKALIEDDVTDLKICTLFDKPSKREVDIEPDYTAFQIEDQFVVGYGLDYDQRYRNLPYVGIVNFV